MYLLDTSIVSYGIRNDPLIELYDTEMAGSDPKFISVQTVGELLIWSEKRNWGEHRQAKLKSDIMKFSILDINRETAEI